MQKEKVIIIGGGPCGLSCAIELQQQGIDALIIEKGNIVNTIYHYPTHQTFFSSSDKLEIGDVPFITENKKPVRNQALAYYREVAARKQLRMNTFEKVVDVKSFDGVFQVETVNNTESRRTYFSENVIVATGYYDQPNYMEVPGESLNKVMHYFKEAHPYYDKNVVVIGGKNSAVDATLELHKAGAHVTVLYRGETYSKSIKPWILPEFDSLIRKGIVKMVFKAQVKNITDSYVEYEVDGKSSRIHNDFVFAMTGYRPNLPFLEQIGVQVDMKTGKPWYNNETYETNIPGIYIAGVVASGFNNNEIFIENGRFHGNSIANHIRKKS
ncbi:YpdA family putative bacillithiol disulfide reductase [Oceanobacillus piezotolerans]|uniref:YpdA family putative bacillithiol disulfide reductase n=1 Tax=Oceanobacillus piezotolerans TaxID=2448030 RepID=A0A498DF81_9BACI|nr:YpdA family putative bacillithiol disulfide reductase [Oceanobacillus piezotolerans]RLL48185.1 YpdA family putative bacillithiol disulfide reductase [Oceanobacillus piezotolerans]